MNRDIKEARDGIYNVLKTLKMDHVANGDLTRLAGRAGALFVDEPLLSDNEGMETFRSRANEQ